MPSTQPLVVDEKLGVRCIRKSNEENNAMTGIRNRHHRNRILIDYTRMYTTLVNIHPDRQKIVY